MITSESDLHVTADNERFEPIRLREDRLAFALPPDCRDIQIVSRTFVPGHTQAESADTRALGICVKRLQIDGMNVALDDASHFHDGWHDCEPGHRWTQGRAYLRPKTQLVVIELAGRGCYWKDEPESAFAFRDDGHGRRG